MGTKLFCEQEEFLGRTLNLSLPLELRQRSDQKQQRKKVILIAGPTGAGKTQLSLILAKSLQNCEIISADSMQVYRGMDIGTAKVSQEHQKTVPHHLIDIRDVTEPFNVVDFYYEAHGAMSHILSQDKCPLVVGGAGFYFRALLYGPPSGPPSVPIVRRALELELECLGVEELFHRLHSLDPEYAATITRGDKHKIVRALEIITLTREPVSRFSWKDRAPPQDYDYRCWFIHRPREQLYHLVDKRCEKMLEDGLIEEVKRLESNGLRSNASAAQAIGYRHCLDYLQTAQSPEDYRQFMTVFKQASRHYAKKQFTWFKKEPSFRWLNVELHDLETAADMILQDYKLA